MNSKAWDRFVIALESKRKELNIQGLAVGLVIKEGNEHRKFVDALGLRNESQLVDVNTRFLIGSTSKLFTSALIAQQVEKGNLDWNTPIKKYISDFRCKDPHVTEMVNLMDLMSHRTGLSIGKNIGQKFQEQLRNFRNAELIKPFRSHFSYNNFGFAVAGYLLSALQQDLHDNDYLHWERLMKSDVLEPLGLESASVSIKEFLTHENRASSYFPNEYGMRPSPIEDEVELEYDLIKPAGSLSLSIVDFCDWLQFLLNVYYSRVDSSVLSNASLNVLFTPRVAEFDQAFYSPSFGIGARMVTYRDCIIATHDGIVAGQQAAFALFPYQDAAFAISYTGGSFEYLSLILDVYQWFFLQDETLPHTTKCLESTHGLRDMRNMMVNSHQKQPPALPLDQYCGTFKQEEYQVRITTTSFPEASLELHGMMNGVPFRAPLFAWDQYDFVGSCSHCFITDEKREGEVVLDPLFRLYSFGVVNGTITSFSSADAIFHKIS
jgi:CubicO group peptidase (beta-lactamase class C family)